ncbi:MAG: hypothetical protein HDQ94_02450 [Desulfovibrio sp.]|nr:hypothetical protein [Desulfovibrio sp.]
MSGRESMENMWTDKVDFKKISPDDPGEFEGFYSVERLVADNLAEVPRKIGVYLVLWPGEKDPETQMPRVMPKFNDGMETGFSQNRVPSLPTKDLPGKWVEGTPVVYIGKAGVLNGRGKSNLHTRLREYLKWYQRKKNKHHGGRDIWRIGNPGKLLVAWRVTEHEDPRSCEATLIQRFKTQNPGHCRPFANRQD